MIKLLTDKDSIVKPGKIIEKVGGSEIEGAEIRGIYKTCSLNITNEDYLSLRKVVEELGLEDYLQMEQHEGTTYIRIIIEEE